MQKELISQRTKERDAYMVTLCGGVIALLGVIAESQILSKFPLDTEALFKVGVGTALGGLSLANGHKIRNLKTYFPVNRK